MNAKGYVFWLLSCVCTFGVDAGEVPVGSLNEFQKGSTAVADEVNANFEKIRQAINDNNHKLVLSAARSACYSALGGLTDHGLILVPLENNTLDLTAVCESKIGSGWHAGGVAKGYYFNQDCGNIDNLNGGGGYTSFVSKQTFEGNRSTYKSCNSSNSFICCSPQF